MLYPKFLHNLRQQALYKPFWALCELSQNIIFNSENSLHSYYASINITYIYIGWSETGGCSQYWLLYFYALYCI